MFSSSKIFKVPGHSFSMLSGLKETITGKRTEQLESKIEESRQLHDSHSKALAELKSDLDKAASAVKSLTEKQQQLSEQNARAIGAVNELKSELSDCINSIKVLSSTIQGTLIRKFSDEISNLTQEVSSKLSGVELLKKEVESTANGIRDELNSLSGDVKKLADVSAHISAKDFEMTKFAAQLKVDDGEKLKLMRQVDSMQRLVSSLRRRH